jgi:hypothetical protein
VARALVATTGIAESDDQERITIAFRRRTIATIST